MHETSLHTGSDQILEVAKALERGLMHRAHSCVLTLAHADLIRNMVGP